MINRFPRLSGVTSIMQQYNQTKDETLKSNLQNYIINHWLLANGTLCGKSYNVIELAFFVQCQPEQIKMFMKEQFMSTKIWDKDKQEELIQSLMGQSLVWAIEDRMEVENQLNLLKTSQGGRYMPFITPEVNKALQLKMGTTTNLQSIIKGMGGGGSINIFNQQQNNVVENHNYLTVEDAVNLVQEENAKLAIGKDQELAYIEAKHDLVGLPEVVASKQIGIDTSREGLNVSKQELTQIADNYKASLEKSDEDHHAMRREIELGIDVDEIDPELELYL